eukprot:5016622-Pyramimonas_sp.AAC.2
MTVWAALSIPDTNRLRVTLAISSEAAGFDRNEWASHLCASKLLASPKSKRARVVRATYCRTRRISSVQGEPVRLDMLYQLVE